MDTCRSCYYCTPYQGKSFELFQWGTCYHAKRKVNADMTSCSLYHPRGIKMTIKSTPDKRNQYRDVDDNIIPGYALQEVLDKPLTILAKREYTWGLYPGMAVKVKSEKGMLAIIEITAGTPIKALNMPQMPKPPYFARFVERMSKNNHKYFTVQVLDRETGEVKVEDERNPLPF